MGIYLYLVMISVFSLLNFVEYVMKFLFSMQEWCGQVYVQFNNRKEFEVMLYFYFEGEVD